MRVRRRAARVLPRTLVRRLARVVRRGTTLSAVLVTTDDNAAHLRECVAAVAGERRVGEVLVVVVGTRAATTQVAADVAADNWRVRRLARPGLSVADAWAAGAGRAGGRLLVLCDAGDVVDGAALGVLTDALVGEGAEVAGGTLSELGRVGLCDVVMTRDLWRRTRPDLPRGPHAEWWAAAQLVRAARRAVTGPALRSGVRRGTGTAFGTMPRLAPWVGPWRRAVDETLTGLGDGPDREAFLGWLLDLELPRYLEDAERCSPQEWTTLVETARSLLDAAPARVLAEVGVESRVRAWLAARSHRQVLEEYNAARWLEEGQFATRVEGDRVHAHLPLPEGLVPQEVLELGTSETPLVAGLRGQRRVGPGRLELEVFAFVRRVDPDGQDVATSMWQVGADGRRTPLTVTEHVDPEVNSFAADAFVDHSGSAMTVTVDVDALGQADRWELEIELRVAGIVRRDRLTGGRPAAEGQPGTGWRVTEVTLDGAHLDVRGQVGPDAHDGMQLELRGPASPQAARIRTDGGDFHCRLAMEHSPWGLGPRPLPSGSYRVHLLREGRDAGGLGFAPAGPLRWQSSELHRVRPRRTGDGTLSVTVGAPLRDDEIGPYAQQQLRRRYVADDRPVDPGAVFLQSYTGSSATDSPLAIHHALRRLRPELKLFWAVADRSTELPEGAVPVLVRSREWYDALATCGHVVTNVDMDRWFVKRPGQRLLQTFHGYPAKTMGIAAWEAKNFTPLRIERLLRRTSGTWDLLLTPTPAMDRHYREQYRYDGEILAAGYPRDDALVGEGATETRAQTRRRLGIAEGRRAVLYAPTWRDDLATNFRSAAMVTGLDTQQLVTELGEDYVVLMRGHRFHRRRHPAGARVVDVTAYPEINDLILAADAAVLDYSSLRFDFALTGRPMVFLVPDLDRYTGGVRGFLYDFRESAPGPLTTTTSEVVARLRDLDGLASEFREVIRRFNADYNPEQDGNAAERAVRAFFGAGD